VTELIIIYLLLRKHFGFKIRLMEWLIEKVNKIKLDSFEHPIVIWFVRRFTKIKLGSFKHSIVRWFIRKFIKKKRTKPIDITLEEKTAN
jgi:hypothetical protein